MATKKAAAPAEAPPAGAPPPASSKKKVVGRPFPKGHPGGPGRPKLPDFFKRRAPKSLEAMLDEAEKEDEDCDNPAVRQRARETVVAYYYGPAKTARLGAKLPKTAEERIKQLEDVVMDAALAGNAEAAVRMLEALDPTRWGKKQSDGGEDEQNDIVDWGPKVEPPTPVKP